MTQHQENVTSLKVGEEFTVTNRSLVEGKQQTLVTVKLAGVSRPVLARIIEVGEHTSVLRRVDDNTKE